MTHALRVADITTYLAHSGWRRQPTGWRGASIWAHKGGYEVLVPARDGMGDGELRAREVVDVLAAIEQRSSHEIVLDITSPLTDTQWFRTFPGGLPSGFTGLTTGLHVLQGIFTMFGSAARAVVEGPHFAFQGEQPAIVGDLLEQVQLGPTLPGSYVFTARLTSDEQRSLARRVLQQLHDAIVAVREAATAVASTGELTAFDDTVTAAVSADFCEGLSSMAGERLHQPFEIAFRWARGLPSELPARSIKFDEEAGQIIRSAADHLRRLDGSDEVTATGIVESLHDDPARDDRWRVKVRGEVSTPRGRGSRRTVWVRLPDGTAYQAAFLAQRENREVRVRGVMSRGGRRVEIRIDSDGFEVLG